jgi:hypothetical protein
MASKAKCEVLDLDYLNRSASTCSLYQFNLVLALFQLVVERLSNDLCGLREVGTTCRKKYEVVDVRGLLREHPDLSFNVDHLKPVGSKVEGIVSNALHAVFIVAMTCEKLQR